MMIKVAIAVGLGVFVLVAICCVSWAVWKLRRRMSNGQISATPDDIPVEDGKDVVLSLPTIKTSDLKIDGGAKLRCPLCWLDFRDEDVMRQLPQCDHIFHRHCIDRLLDKKITCPVCSSVLTDHHSVKEAVLSARSKAAYDQFQEDSPSAYTRTPSWVHVNRPVPLPLTTRVNSSSSSERFEIDLNNSADSIGSSRNGEYPLLKHVVTGSSSHAAEWNRDVDDLEKCIDISFTFGTEIPVEKQQHSSRQSSMDSFSFEDAFTFETAPARHLRRGSQSTWEFGHPVHLQEVSEEHTRVPSLTRPPERCSFDVLPVVTRSSGNHHGLKSASEEPMKVSSNRHGYSHL